MFSRHPWSERWPEETPRVSYSGQPYEPPKKHSTTAVTLSPAERREETAVQRAQRLAEYDRRPEWQREAWRELPEAFDFRLAAQEVWDGHSLYVIEAAPRQGYQPRSRTAKVLPTSRASFGWTSRTTNC